MMQTTWVLMTIPWGAGFHRRFDLVNTTLSALIKIQIEQVFFYPKRAVIALPMVVVREVVREVTAVEVAAAAP